MPPRPQSRAIRQARVPAATLRSLAVVAALAAAPAVADRAADERTIRDAAAAYVKALERGDSAALANAWTADGDIVDEFGDVLKGRDTVAVVPAAAAGAARPEVKLSETSLRFLTDDVAVEDGTVEVRLAGGEAQAGRFSATWVRADGAWKLAALREARSTDGPATDRLTDLDWMVGRWASADGDATHASVEMVVRWNDTHTYLIREMRVRPAGAPADAPGLTVTQLIGQDPLTKRLRGWAFGSDGSHGEATLSQNGGSWIAETRSVRPDGSLVSALNVYTYDGTSRCTWRSLPTQLGAGHAAEFVVTLVRQEAAKP
jgi:uncharacterized protein (TIGR02246 family)